MVPDLYPGSHPLVPVNTDSPKLLPPLKILRGQAAMPLASVLDLLLWASDLGSTRPSLRSVWWPLPCPCWVICRCLRSLPHHKLGKETQDHCFRSFLDLHSGWRSLWPRSLPCRPLQGYRWDQDVHKFLLPVAPVHCFWAHRHQPSWSSHLMEVWGKQGCGLWNPALFSYPCFLSSSQRRGHLPVSSNNLCIFSLLILQKWLNALLFSVKWAFENEYISLSNIPKLLRLSEDSRKPSFRLNDPLFQVVLSFLL